MHLPPVAVGGVGGSGTRVIASLLARLGFHIGSDLNEEYDNLWFTLLFKRIDLWPIAAHEKDLDEAVKFLLNAMVLNQPWSPAQVSRMEDIGRAGRPGHPAAWLAKRVSSLAQAVPATEPLGPNGRWGWKEPNTHIVLPALVARIPGLKYIHVMRHGVDMAFSRNQNQLAFWGEAMLGRKPDLESPRDSLSYWCEVSRRTRAVADNQLKDRFLLLDFDRLCKSGEPELDQLLHFLSIDSANVDRQSLLTMIRVPESAGRFRQHDLAVFRQEDLAYVRSLGYQL